MLQCGSSTNTSSNDTISAGIYQQKSLVPFFHRTILMLSKLGSDNCIFSLFHLSGILNQIREFRFHPNMAHNQYDERTQAAQRIATPGVGFNAVFTGPQRSPPSLMLSATNITSHPP